MLAHTHIHGVLVYIVYIQYRRKNVDKTADNTWSEFLVNSCKSRRFETVRMGSELSMDVTILERFYIHWLTHISIVHNLREYVKTVTYVHTKLDTASAGSEFTVNTTLSKADLFLLINLHIHSFISLMFAWICIKVSRIFAQNLTPFPQGQIYRERHTFRCWSILLNYPWFH